ncbi:MAG: AraC family transcriptional regulator, partial [Clostridiales bacterium]|nr:AraC family transcriptional regulator [Clostridiales bacterium]
NNYFDSESTVKRGADHVKVDRTYLFRLFKKETGSSIIDYINNKKISKAVVMLSDESVSVKDISVAIGFTDQMYFSKVFKKIKGVTPTEYRKSCTKVYRLP